MMTRLLRLAVLSLTSSIVVASHSRPTAPWGIPRGGSDSTYAGQLETVKTSVLEAANDSVRNS